MKAPKLILTLISILLFTVTGFAQNPDKAAKQGLDPARQQ